MDSLIERLQSAADAYPEDVFGKTTDEDRRAHGDVVQRAAATMGRHMAPLLREAAAALEAARKDVARVDWLEQADFSSVGDGGKSGVQITVYPLDGDGEWYGGRTLREAIDAAREARNG